MVKDFLYTVYCEHPEEIEAFLPKEFSGQFKKLLSKKLLDDESITIYASIAAKKAFDFDINKILNIVCDITHKTNLSECKKNFSNLKENLRKIFKIRNALGSVDSKQTIY